MLRDFMIYKCMIVIEHNDFFFGVAIFNNDPDPAMFWYKKEKKIVSHESLDHAIKMQVSKGALIIQSYRYFSN